MDLLPVSGIAAITALCSLLGEGVKISPLDNRYIPLLCGALGALMTGTGSAVFGVFREIEAAEAARAELAKEYRYCRTAEAVGALL